MTEWKDGSSTTTIWCIVRWLLFCYFCITCIGTQNKKHLGSNACKLSIVSISIRRSSDSWFSYFYNMVHDEGDGLMASRLYGIRLNVIFYMISLSSWYDTVHVALDNISKFLKEGLLLFAMLREWDQLMEWGFRAMRYSSLRTNTR